MADQTITAAAVVSFCERLEDGSARFYAELAKRFAEQSEVFEGFVKDSAKNKLHVVRTYQETITDALEAGYAFEGLKLGDAMFGIALSADIGLAGAIGLAVALEDQAVTYYLDIADRSQALLATIPGAFRKVAKNRANRKRTLEVL
jgi:hypothetical protein